MCADGKYKDEAYAEERKLNLNPKRAGNIDDGIEALVDLIEDRKTLLWMPTGSFPVADFAFSKQHFIHNTAHPGGNIRHALRFQHARRLY